MADPLPPITDAPDVVPELGPDEDGDIFRKLKGWVQSSISHLSDWRKEAIESYEFYSGHQWSKEELDAFASDQRVAPIFNLTAVNVDAVCGLEVNNRQDVKYLPRTAGDVKVNDLLSSAAMWVRDQAQSEDEESDSFKDAVISGIGSTETRKIDPETIAIDRRDPTEMFWDKTAKKANLVDRRFAGRIVWMDADEAEGMFPGVPLATLNAKWAVLGTTEGVTNTELLDYPDHQRDGPGIPETGKLKKVCLVEVEWFDWDTPSPQMPGMPPVSRQKVYKQAFLGNSGVLEINPLEAWAYNFITGKRDQKKNTWYGIVRALKDPQKLINKFLATSTHIISTNAKGGLLYERGAFNDPRQAEWDWSNPQKNIEVAEGYLANGKIQPRTAPPFPESIVRLIDFAMTNIRGVSGINVELLGAADRDQPASLELQRRQSAVTILASLFDAKRRYHKEQGRTLLALMKTLPPETLVKVTIDPPDQSQQPQLPPGADPAQAQAMQQQAQQREVFVQMQLISQAFSDPSIKYDVIVDEAPSSPNQQQEITAKIAMMAQQGLQFTPQTMAILVKNIGLPSTVADEIADSITGAQQDPQVQQLTEQLQQGAQVLQQTQGQLQQTQSELQGVKMDRNLDFQQAQTDQYKAQTDRMKVQNDIQQSVTAEQVNARVDALIANLQGGQ